MGTVPLGIEFLSRLISRHDSRALLFSLNWFESGLMSSEVFQRTRGVLACDFIQL